MDEKDKVSDLYKIWDSIFNFIASIVLWNEILRPTCRSAAADQQSCVAAKTAQSAKAKVVAQTLPVQNIVSELFKVK